MYSANIVTENGDSFIPASQRPDGTWRKARRVKEGYVPQEEVPLYESKGKQFINRQSKPAEPVKLPSGHTAHSSIPGLFILEEKKPTKKKTKAKAVEEVANKLQNVTIKENTAKQEQQAIDPTKRLKNLKKKVREIDVLEEKIKKGEIVKPETEQLAKIKRKNDLLLEIRQLEKKLDS